MKATQEKGAGALQVGGGIVERRHTLPILANVLMRKNGSRSSSPPATWRSRCAPRRARRRRGNFSHHRGARKLIDILRSLPADQTVVTPVGQNKLTLQGGKSRFTLQTLPADDFPLVNEAADFGPMFSVPQKTLKRPDQPGALRDGGARHPLLPQRHPCSWPKARASRWWPPTATAWRWRRPAGRRDPSKQEVILPRKTVLELQRLLKDEDTAIEMRFAGNQAQVRLRGMEFVTKLVEASSPTTTA